MPLSRGRKNKKKKKIPQKKSETNYEKFSGNGFDIIRDGKNVYLKTNRSAEDQKQLVERIKIERPKILASLQEMINRITEIFSTYNNFQLLGMLAYNLIVNQKNDDGASELAMEYGMSFSIAIKDNPSEEPTEKVGSVLIETLNNVRQVYSQYIMTEFVEGNYNDKENHLRFKTIMESLYMRGDGYPQHIYTIFEELFSGHDKFLEEKYGFKTGDILETILQLEESFCCKMLSPQGMPHPIAHLRFNEWIIEKGLTPEQVKDDQSVVDFLNDNTDFISNGAMPGGFFVNDVEQYEDLYKITYRKPIHKKVVEAIAISFGDNHDFLNPKYPGLPLNESLAYLKPVIHHNSEYYLFAFGVMTRNIFSIGEKLILDADKVYYNKKFLGNNFSASRDNFLENKTADLFKNFIPKSSPYLNLKYKPGQLDDKGKKIETELDLLLISEKAIYIIEMKAGGLSAPSKRGALKSLTGQLSETIGYGAFQSHRAYKYITEDPDPVFYDGKGNSVTIDKSKKVFRITITLEHLSGFIANIHDLRLLGVVKKDVEFAWTSSLFDLMIFSEIMENEDDFLEYLEKRLPLYSSPIMEVDDEIDFLGYFLENDELVDNRAAKKVTSYKLNKTSEEIDDYFLRGGSKPLRKRKDKPMR